MGNSYIWNYSLYIELETDEHVIIAFYRCRLYFQQAVVASDACYESLYFQTFLKISKDKTQCI